MGSVRPGLFKANFGLGSSSLRTAMRPDEVEKRPRTVIRSVGVSPTVGLAPNLNGLDVCTPGDWVRCGTVRVRFRTAYESKSLGIAILGTWHELR